MEAGNRRQGDLLPFVRPEWPTEVEDDPRLLCLDLDAVAADLFGTTVDADLHELIPYPQPSAGKPLFGDGSHHLECLLGLSVARAGWSRLKTMKCRGARGLGLVQRRNLRATCAASGNLETSKRPPCRSKESGLMCVRPLRAECEPAPSEFLAAVPRFQT